MRLRWFQLFGASLVALTALPVLHEKASEPVATDMTLVSDCP